MKISVVFDTQVKALIFKRDHPTPLAACVLLPLPGDTIESAALLDRIKNALTMLEEGK